MKYIKLTQGKFAKVSDEDFEYLNQFKWCVSKNYGLYYYAMRSVKRNRKRNLFMHHHVLERMGIKTKYTDHKDHDGLNNQRENLRPCTNQQNQWNSRKYKNNTSGVKGVHWNKNAGKWQARIKSMENKNI